MANPELSKADLALMMQGNEMIAMLLPRASRPGDRFHGELSEEGTSLKVYKQPEHNAPQDGSAPATERWTAVNIFFESYKMGAQAMDQMKTHIQEEILKHFPDATNLSIRGLSGVNADFRIDIKPA